MQKISIWDPLTNMSNHDGKIISDFRDLATKLQCKNVEKSFVNPEQTEDHNRKSNGLFGNEFEEVFEQPVLKSPLAKNVPTMSSETNESTGKEDKEIKDGSKTQESTSDKNMNSFGAMGKILHDIIKVEDEPSDDAPQESNNFIVLGAEKVVSSIAEVVPGGGLTVFFTTAAMMAGLNFFLWYKYQRPNQARATAKQD